MGLVRAGAVSTVDWSVTEARLAVGGQAGVGQLWDL